MTDPERQTSTHIRQLLDRAGLKPRHDLGQNFLIDLNLLDLIVESAELSPNDIVLEVGTGTGSLTAKLAQRAKHVVAVEYDPEMARLTTAAVAQQTNVTLLNRDVLRNKNHLAEEVLEALSAVLSPRPRRAGEGQGRGGERFNTLSRGEPAELEQAISQDSSRESARPLSLTLSPAAGARGPEEGESAGELKLVANLPYHVATPVLSNVVATELPWTRMVVTIQRELAERMLAAPRTPDYSALSVWLQSQCRLEILRRLPPSVFWPQPKVDSAIVRIDRDVARQSQIADRTAFHEFLRDVFTQRRKHLIGVVAKLFSGKIDRGTLEAIHRDFGWPLEVRAEELSVDQFVAYHNRLVEITS